MTDATLPAPGGDPPIVFPGRRTRAFAFAAGLGVLMFGAICVGIALSGDLAEAWGAEVLFGVCLLACVAWLAYVLTAPTMTLSITEQHVRNTARLTGFTITREEGDLLVFEEIAVSGGRPTATAYYWKVRAPSAMRGILLTQWNAREVADACGAKGWQVEWRDRDAVRAELKAQRKAKREAKRG